MPGKVGSIMMNALPALIVIWSVATGVFLLLLAYNATITRYEDSQLFLDEVSESEEKEQNSIVRKVNRTLPYIRVTGTLSAILTVVIIGIYTWDCWQKLQGQ
jgi:hypothetical protein